MSLIEFLRERLDEDERGARDAGAGGWVAAGLAFVDDSEGHQMVRDESMGSGVQAHIARHDPARLLAEVAAKRAILEIHTLSTKPETKYFDDVLSHSVSGGRSLTVRGPNGGWRETGRTLYSCSQCDSDRHEEYYAPVEGCGTLRALVSVWADHPDFDPDWAVTE